MKRKNKLIIFSTIIILVITSILVLSYGFYHTIVEGNETSKKAILSSQVISVEFSDGSESLTSSGKDIYFYPGSTLTKTFTIKNTGNVEAKYSVNLSDVVNNFERKEDLIYELKSGEKILASGSFPSSDVSLIKKEVLPKSETKTYILTIKYLESTENQIIDNGKLISANIFIDQNIKYINELKIYGNSVQDGTPSPETPVDVLNLGENSSNLYNQKEQTINVLGVDNIFTKNDITMNGTATGSGGRLSYDYNSLKLKANVTYTLVVRYNSGSAVIKPTVYLSNISGNAQIAAVTVQYSGNITLKTFTPETDMMVRMGINVNVDSVYTNYKFNVTVNEGSYTNSTAPKYRPYNYIDVKGSSKNYFDISKVIEINGVANYCIQTLIPNGLKLEKNDTIWGQRINISKLVSGKSYTLSFTLKEKNSNNISVLLREQGSSSSSTWSDKIMLSNYSVGDRISILMEPTLDSNYIQFYQQAGWTSAGDGYAISDIQIEENTEATSYEPYQEPKITTIDMTGHEPLRKIGDVSDYIDYKNQKIIRNIARYTFTGDEDWTVRSSSLSNFKFSAPNVLNMYLGNKCLSNIGSFPNGTNAYTYGIVGVGLWVDNVNAGKIVYIETDINHISTIEQLKTYLKNNEVYVFYLLATPVEEPINLPEIEVQPFTNNITMCDNLICSSNVEIEYE